jgi:putative spermidine/putrescine transport system ATP-binding protein
MSFVRLENVTKRFDSFTAVDDLSISIEKGEFVSLLGPSGCGKTTTLQMIAGLQEPTAGRIHLDGEDITYKKPNQRGLGIVFQSYALFPHMTVEENVSFGLEMRRVDRGEREQRVRRSLEQVQLDSLAKRYPKDLSGGQRQRVALARALVIQPPVLLLDEPLSNLDAKLREDMQLELRVLQQQLGVTTILVTHDQAEALSMSDRIVVMNEGRAVQIDAPLTMYERPETAFVSNFVGKTNLLQGVVTAAEQDGATVRVGEQSLSGEGPGLSDGAAVTVSLRPEKLRLSAQAEDQSIPGQVSAGIFLGNHWLYQIDSALGTLLVSQANRGTPPFVRGDPVHIHWVREGVRLMPGEVPRG